VIGPVYRKRLRSASRRVLPLLFAGNRVECPCCCGTFRRFVPRYGGDGLCPRCLSLGRHRLLWLYLRDQVGLGESSARVLHFAPEEGIERRLRALDALTYVTADIDASSIATVRADITATPFEDAAFDVVLCSHVLEHVEDDRAAMRELHRVLRTGGVLYSLHPVDEERGETFEDSTITRPADRKRAFGQRDHVRIYGRDFVKRLEDAGFAVSAERYRRTLTSDVIARYHPADDPVYVCVKSSLGQRDT
jgi:SAM-dependent methyltransferase